MYARARSTVVYYIIIYFNGRFSAGCITQERVYIVILLLCYIYIIYIYKRNAYIRHSNSKD